MPHKWILCFVSSVLIGFLFAASSANAQTIAYRQTNLSSNVPNVANNLAPGLANPWGIAFLSGNPFFIADNNVGRVTVLDASGLGVVPGSFVVPDAAGTGFDTPTGIVADQNSFFGDASVRKPFILVTDRGAILTWGPDANGDLPQQATPRRRIAGAVYKGAAILNSSLTAPALAVTDFHNGFIQTFLPGFSLVALPGSFTDPNLPTAYAPFGIQVIGTEIFVTYAVQDSAKHDPIAGAGNGIVSIFDMDGNFVRRFATGGTLNAPWGVTRASTNFGPFSNDILIGNVGDGSIGAFDPTSGQFVGQLLNGDGLALAEVGLHALVFRADRFGDQNTLYFTSQLTNESDGLFAAITPGLVSVTRVSAPNVTADATVTITVNVAAGPANPGTPTGSVTFLDGSTQLRSATLINGLATFDTIFADIGIHNIAAQYSGDSVFLASHVNIPLQVTGLVTTLTLTARADAAPSSPVTLTASVNSAAGIPTGQIVFHDGASDVGTSPLDGAGVAILRIILTAGAHSLTASYAGDGKFGGSTASALTINVANADFLFGATPSSATVTAGQSTQFVLTLTPAGGFANSVTFSCAPIIGIACSFSPTALTPANAAVSTTLTVTTSASVSRYGLLMFNLLGPCTLVLALVLSGLAMRRAIKFRTARTTLLTAIAALTILAVSLTLSGCGGYGGAMQSNRGTASIIVTAQSGPISHTTTVRVSVQ
jgi:uncharacterized protein (TIGR03118 family)